MVHHTQHPFLQSLRTAHSGKVVPARDAVRLIGEGDTVATGGFIGTGFAEGIAAVQELTDRFYSGVTRDTTSGFLRMKLGDALGKRQLAPHIYETADEARTHL